MNATLLLLRRSFRFHIRSTDCLQQQRQMRLLVQMWSIWVSRRCSFPGRIYHSLTGNAFRQSRRSRWLNCPAQQLQLNRAQNRDSQSTSTCRLSDHISRSTRFVDKLGWKPANHDRQTRTNSHCRMRPTRRHVACSSATFASIGLCADNNTRRFGDRSTIHGHLQRIIFRQESQRPQWISLFALVLCKSIASSSGLISQLSSDSSNRRDLLKQSIKIGWGKGIRRLPPTAYNAPFNKAIPRPCRGVASGDDKLVQVIVWRSIASTLFKVLRPSRPPTISCEFKVENHKMLNENSI